MFLIILMENLLNLTEIETDPYKLCLFYSAMPWSGLLETHQPLKGREHESECYMFSID